MLRVTMPKSCNFVRALRECLCAVAAFSDIIFSAHMVSIADDVDSCQAFARAAHGHAAPSQQILRAMCMPALTVTRARWPPALVRAARGSNIVVSSGARSAFELRGPYDVVNLAMLMGLRGDQAQARTAAP
jgi:hypothetical protein